MSDAIKPTSHPTGDRGQRYEVRYLDHDDVEHVMGWADDPTPFVKCISLHPSFHSPRVIDRSEAAKEADDDTD